MELLTLFETKFSLVYKYEKHNSPILVNQRVLCVAHIFNFLENKLCKVTLMCSCLPESLSSIVTTLCYCVKCEEYAIV